MLGLFLKYLERLHSVDRDKRAEVARQELRTLESILLTELRASFEQQKHVERLVKRKEEHRKSKGLWKAGQNIFNYAAGMTTNKKGYN